MPTEFTLKGVLDKVVVEESFDDCLAGLNRAAATGNDFWATHDTNGEWHMIRVSGIGYAREVEPEFPYK